MIYLYLPTSKSACLQATLISPVKLKWISNNFKIKMVVARSKPKIIIFRLFFIL